MNTTEIELKVKDLIARTARRESREIDSSKWATDYGVDSLGLLALRENLERMLSVYLPDDAWIGFRSIAELVSFIGGQRPATDKFIVETAPANISQQPQRGLRLSPSGLLYDEIEIGMPFTGLINLAENPLLKYLGDLRWKHLSALCGAPSKQIVDEEGQRLYPTFFYVEMAFPEQKPMAAFGENDRLKIVSSLKRFGGSMLDGVLVILPPDHPETDQASFDDLSSALAAGFPAARLSNIFVKQFAGAEWLKKSRPANPGFERIAEMAVAPDSYAYVKQAEKDGRFARPPENYLPMTDGAARTEYRLIADRDLNGAGLVYFANYPVFLDICEREVLAAANLPLTDELIDRRTIKRRRSAYLNNASSRDTLIIEVEPWIENPFSADSPAPEMAPIRLFLNYRMYRRSDERLMMVSTAEKLIFGRAMEDVPFFSKLSVRRRKYVEC